MTEADMSSYGRLYVGTYPLLAHIDETRMSGKFEGSPWCKNRRHVSLPCAIARKSAGLRHTLCWYK